ncbi:MAG: hypothetical protein EOM68_07130 [Spirochaetia bacterium]|nr:hypothetical protein [Spirochaetia bacterium]
MKRFLLVLVCMALGISSLFSYPLLQSERGTIGMGSTGVALSSSPSSFFYNPALLYASVREKGFFTLTGSYHDSIRPANFRDQVQNPLMQNPFSHLSVSFSGNNVALTLQSQVSLEDRQEISGLTRYRGRNHTLLQLDWAIGRSVFAFGVNVKALSVSERNPLDIRNDRILADFFVQTSLGRFELLESEALISVGFGLLLDYDWFKMGITSDTFASALGSDPLQISADEIYKSLDWGFSFSTPTYDSNNLLHLFKLQGALDFVDLGSEESRELRTGFDLKLQLLPQWSVSLKSGYREKKKLPSDLLKFDITEGTHTLGLGARLGAFTIDLAFEIPIDWYRGKTDDDSTVEGMLAISFSL